MWRLFGLIILSSIGIVLGSCVNNSKKEESHNSVDKLKIVDCISDSLSAINFAKVKWEEKFGKEIYERGPFDAKLVNDSIWLVSSSDELIKNPKPGTFNFGGVLSIQIRKRDCEILEINVTK